MEDVLKLLENHALLPVLCVASFVGIYRLLRLLIVEAVKPSAELVAAKFVESCASFERTQLSIVGAIERLQQHADRQAAVTAEILETVRAKRTIDAKRETPP